MCAMALLELPRGCDYWNDERMRFMVNGTDSTVHEFDGCMYGLKSQFNHVGTAIKKPWRVVSRGVSFSDLHAKCDGSHAHGPCAGKETRATQLYTDKIVKCIIRGVKNQMLWNNAYGRKYEKGINRLSPSQPKVKACACVIVGCKEDEVTINQSCGQHLLDWICRRGGLKVKLGYNLQRRNITADPDSPLAGLLVAMAEKKLTIPTANKGYISLKSTLSWIRQKEQTEQLPKAFSTYDEAGGRICQERDIDNWMNVAQISAPVVVALAFVMRRSHRTQVTHAIHLLLKLMMRVNDDGELKLTVVEFVEKGSRLSKLVERGSRQEEDAKILTLLCTFECGMRIDEFWESLRNHYSGTSNMINRSVSVQELREKIASTSVVNLGSLSQSHPPYNSQCHQIRQRSAFYNMTRVYWEKWTFEKMKMESCSMEELEKRVKTLCDVIEDSWRLCTKKIQCQDVADPEPDDHPPERPGRLGVHAL